MYDGRCLSVSDALVCTCLHLFALVLRSLVIRLISSLYRGSAKDSYERTVKGTDEWDRKWIINLFAEPCNLSNKEGDIGTRGVRLRTAGFMPGKSFLLFSLVCLGSFGLLRLIWSHFQELLVFLFLLVWFRYLTLRFLTLNVFNCGKHGKGWLLILTLNQLHTLACWLFSSYWKK